MDEVIFQEFKGTGNMEVQLDRPNGRAPDIPGRSRSARALGTTTALPELLRRVWPFAANSRNFPPVRRWTIKNIKATSSNAELLLAGLRQ